jgi:hypothetical protein
MGTKAEWTTFGGRLLDEYPSQVSSQPTVKIICEPFGSYYVVADYPADEKFVCGLLTWLSIRSRRGVILNKLSFKTNNDTEASIVSDIVEI